MTVVDFNQMNVVRFAFDINFMNLRYDSHIDNYAELSTSGTLGLFTIQQNLTEKI